jgi:ketosteroid isomerase-like protein
MIAQGDREGAARRKANMTFAKLPSAVATFLRAVQSRDGPDLLAIFTEPALLVDQGREYRGDAIKQWCDRIFWSVGATAHPINLAGRSHKTALTVMVKQAGRAGAAEFDWLFTIEGGKICDLTITRARSIDLQAPVAAYIQATNIFDLDALVATFADDALVNDQLCDYCGKAAIREWAERDIIGLRVTMYVVKAVQHYGHTIVTANVDGDYDKRGLPDPLVLAFYFSAYRDKIVQLIILRNEPSAG